MKTGERSLKDPIIFVQLLNVKNCCCNAANTLSDVTVMARNKRAGKCSAMLMVHCDSMMAKHSENGQQIMKNTAIILNLLATAWECEQIVGNKNPVHS